MHQCLATCCSDFSIKVHSNSLQRETPIPFHFFKCKLKEKLFELHFMVRTTGWIWLNLKCFSWYKKMFSIIFEIDDDDIIFSSYAHGGNHRILLQRRNKKLWDMFDGQNRLLFWKTRIYNMFYFHIKTCKVLDRESGALLVSAVQWQIGSPLTN